MQCCGVYLLNNEWTGSSYNVWTTVYFRLVVSEE